MGDIVHLRRRSAELGHHVRPSFMVAIIPEPDGYLVVSRQHSWFHSRRSEALKDAHEIAAGFGAGLLIHLGGRS